MAGQREDAVFRRPPARSSSCPTPPQQVRPSGPLDERTRSVRLVSFLPSPAKRHRVPRPPPVGTLRPSHGAAGRPVSTTPVCFPFATDQFSRPLNLARPRPATSKASLAFSAQSQVCSPTSHSVAAPSTGGHHATSAAAGPPAQGSRPDREPTSLASARRTPSGSPTAPGPPGPAPRPGW